MRQRLLYCAKEVLVVERLFEEIDGARLHRPYSSR
jgi:hypothetical protein